MTKIPKKVYKLALKYDCLLLGPESFKALRQIGLRKGKLRNPKTGIQIPNYMDSFILTLFDSIWNEQEYDFEEWT